EDGIRDDLVTGVQTCALPICAAHDVEVAVVVLEACVRRLVVAGKFLEVALAETLVLLPQRRQAGGRQRQLHHDRAHLVGRHLARSEERRVGKGGNGGGGPARW